MMCRNNSEPALVTDPIGLFFAIIQLLPSMSAICGWCVCVSACLSVCLFTFLPLLCTFRFVICLDLFLNVVFLKKTCACPLPLEPHAHAHTFKTHNTRRVWQRQAERHPFLLGVRYRSAHLDCGLRAQQLARDRERCWSA